MTAKLSLSFKTNINPFNISKIDSFCAKGILAVFILIHHLYQHSGIFHGSLIGNALQALGYLTVACFFFLSGYGLYKSHC